MSKLSAAELDAYADLLDRTQPAVETATLSNKDLNAYADLLDREDGFEQSRKASQTVLSKAINRGVQNSKSNIASGVEAAAQAVKGLSNAPVDLPTGYDPEDEARISGATAQATEEPSVLRTLRNATIKAESNGKLNAKNPNSTAFGPAQALKSTWLEAFPEIYEGDADALSDEKKLALRADMELSKKFVDNYNTKTIAGLTAAKLPVNAGTVYASYIFGRDGGRRILRADPSTPMTELVSQKVMDDNPNLIFKKDGTARTASELIALTSEKMAKYKGAPAQAARPLPDTLGGELEPTPTESWLDDIIGYSGRISRESAAAAAEHPASVPSWTDIDSVESAATFALEVGVSQIPNLVGSIVAGVATGGLASGARVLKYTDEVYAVIKKATKALPKNQRERIFAAVKKTVDGGRKKNIAEGMSGVRPTWNAKLFNKYLGKVDAKKLGEVIEGAALKRAAVNLGRGGVAALGLAGENYKRQIEAGVAPAEAGAMSIAMAVPQAGLDVLGLNTMLGSMFKSSKVAPDTIMKLIGAVGARVGVASAGESVTEGVQNVLSMVAVKLNDPKYEVFSEENIDEIVESMVQGGVGAGTLTTPSTTLHETGRYAGVKVLQAAEAAAGVSEKAQKKAQEKVKATVDAVKKWHGETLDDTLKQFREPVADDFVGPLPSGLHASQAADKVKAATKKAYAAAKAAFVAAAVDDKPTAETRAKNEKVVEDFMSGKWQDATAEWVKAQREALTPHPEQYERFNEQVKEFQDRTTDLFNAARTPEMQAAATQAAKAYASGLMGVYGAAMDGLKNAAADKGQTTLSKEEIADLKAQNKAAADVIAERFAVAGQTLTDAVKIFSTLTEQYKKKADERKAGPTANNMELFESTAAEIAAAKKVQQTYEKRAVSDASIEEHHATALEVVLGGLAAQRPQTEVTTDAPTGVNDDAETNSNEIDQTQYVKAWEEMHDSSYRDDLTTDEVLNADQEGLTERANSIEAGSITQSTEQAELFGAVPGITHTTFGNPVLVGQTSGITNLAVKTAPFMGHKDNGNPSDSALAKLEQTKKDFPDNEVEFVAFPGTTAKGQKRVFHYVVVHPSAANDLSSALFTPSGLIEKARVSGNQKRSRNGLTDAQKKKRNIDPVKAAEATRELIEIERVATKIETDPDGNKREVALVDNQGAHVMEKVTFDAIEITKLGLLKMAKDRGVDYIRRVRAADAYVAYHRGLEVLIEATNTHNEDYGLLNSTPYDLQSSDFQTNRNLDPPVIYRYGWTVNDKLDGEEQPSNLFPSTLSSAHAALQKDQQTANFESLDNFLKQFNTAAKGKQGTRLKAMGKLRTLRWDKHYTKEQRADFVNHLITLVEHEMSFLDPTGEAKHAKALAWGKEELQQLQDARPKQDINTMARDGAKAELASMFGEATAAQIILAHKKGGNFDDIGELAVRAKYLGSTRLDGILEANKELGVTSAREWKTIENVIDRLNELWERPAAVLKNEMEQKDAAEAAEQYSRLSDELANLKNTLSTDMLPDGVALAESASVLDLEFNEIFNNSDTNVEGLRIHIPTDKEVLESTSKELILASEQINSLVDTLASMLRVTPKHPQAEFLAQKTGTDYQGEYRKSPDDLSRENHQDPDQVFSPEPTEIDADTMVAASELYHIIANATNMLRLNAYTNKESVMGENDYLDFNVKRKEYDDLVAKNETFIESKQPDTKYIKGVRIQIRKLRTELHNIEANIPAHRIDLWASKDIAEIEAYAKTVFQHKSRLTAQLNIQAFNPPTEFVGPESADHLRKGKTHGDPTGHTAPFTRQRSADAPKSFDEAMGIRADLDEVVNLGAQLQKFAALQTARNAIEYENTINGIIQETEGTLGSKARNYNVEGEGTKADIGGSGRIEEGWQRTTQPGYRGLLPNKFTTVVKLNAKMPSTMYGRNILAFQGHSVALAKTLRQLMNATNSEFKAVLLNDKGIKQIVDATSGGIIPTDLTILLNDKQERLLSDEDIASLGAPYEPTLKALEQEVKNIPLGSKVANNLMRAIRRARRLLENPANKGLSQTEQLTLMYRSLAASGTTADAWAVHIGDTAAVKKLALVKRLNRWAEQHGERTNPYYDMETVDLLAGYLEDRKAGTEIKTDDHTIIYVNDAEGSSKTQQQLAIAHEFGHAFMSNQLQKAPEAVRTALSKAYKASGYSEAMMETDPETGEVRGSYNEWFADQMAAYIANPDHLDALLGAEKTDPEGNLFRIDESLVASGVELGEEFAFETDLYRERTGGKPRTKKAKATESVGLRAKVRKAVKALFEGIKDGWKNVYEHMQKKGGVQFKEALPFTEYMNNILTNSSFKDPDPRAAPNEAVDGGSTKTDTQSSYRETPAPDENADWDTFARQLGETFALAITPSRRDRARVLFNRALQGAPGLLMPLASADQQLRFLGAEGIANKLWLRPQTTAAKLPWLNAVAQRSRQWGGQYEAVLKGMTSDQRNAALVEMQNEQLSDTDISPQTLKLRKVHREFGKYLSTLIPNFTTVANHFPRVYNTSRIEAEPQAFVDFVVADGRYTPAEAASFMRAILNNEEPDISLSPSTGSGSTRARTFEIGTGKLADGGWLHPDPQYALMSSVRRSIRHAELGKLFGGDYIDTTTGEVIFDPTMQLKAEIQALPTAQARNRARVVVEGIFGQRGMSMNPNLRKYQNNVMAVQNWLTLIYTAVASIPEMAGPILRAKDLEGATEGLHSFIRTVKDRKEAYKRYSAMGFLEETLANQAMAEVYGLDSNPSWASTANKKLFFLNGQEWFTNMSRVMSAAVAEDFILRHGELATNENSEAYLKELNLTPALVQQWNALGRPIWKAEDQDPATSEIAQRVQDAIGIFVDQSVVNPNNAMKPVFMSDPRFALVTHLKTFYYAFQHTVLEGIWNNMKQKDGLPAKAVPVAMAAFTMMPLSGLSLETREILQYWGQKDPTDNQDTGPYLWNLFRRAGGLGVLELGFSAADAQGWNGSAFTRLAGPTVGHMDSILSDPTGRGFWRSVPVAGQMPALRHAIGG